MPRTNPSYLHRNRHGTFSLRLRPPADVIAHFAQAAFSLSLMTKDRALALRRARRAAISVDSLISICRAMKPKKDRVFTTYLVRRFVLPNGTTHEIDYDASKPEETAEAQRIFDDLMAAQAVSQPDGALPRQELAPSVDSQAASARGPTISVVLAQFVAERGKDGSWKDPDTMERYEYGPIVAMLIAVAGDRAIGTLSGDHVRRVKKQLLDESDSLSNKRKKAGRLSAFLRWARRQGHVDVDHTPILKIGNGNDESKHYQPFTDEELKKLYESEAYRTQSSAKASEFWVPLLGLYTGARINELAQLHLNDIGEQDGVPTISIDDVEGKIIKNTASKRTVPIHPNLVAAGLLEYAAQMRSDGWTRLFPELSRSARAKDSHGKEMTRFFTTYRRDCGVSPDQDRVKVFHSLRTTANSKLRFAGVPQERRERLIGHESDDINNQAYRPEDRDKMFPIAMLLADLSELHFGLTHPIYAAQPAHRSARFKAARGRKRRKASEAADAAALESASIASGIKAR